MSELNRRMLKSRRKTKIYIYILVGLSVAVLAYGAGWYLNHKNNSSKFEAAAKTFIQILEEKTYDKLGNVLEEQSYLSQEYTLEEVEDKYERIFNGIQARQIQASHIKMKRINQQKQQLTYKLSFRTPLGKLENLNYQTTIQKSGDRYLVSWDPSLVLPGMEGKDKVAFQYWKAERGDIKDRLGNGLAVNADFKWAGIVPNDLGSGSQKQKKLRVVSSQLDMPLDDLTEKLNQSWVKNDLFVPIKLMEPKDAYMIPGVSYQNTKIRYYPLKEAAAHLIGYTGKATKEDLNKHPELTDGEAIGKSGLERTFDKKLRGKNGGQIKILDAAGNEKQIFQEVKKVDGEDIQLTIDAYIQEAAFTHLKSKAGSTVVMDPKEGGLYAVVSSPAYDPNKMVQGLSQKEYDTYVKAEDKPFIPRFATGYAPGSTFKTITASIGLDEDVTQPDKSRTIHGLSWQKDGSWGGYSVTRVKRASHVDMRKALIYSDNIYFAQEALEMGEKTFRNGLNRFNFGEKMDVPIAMEPAQISNKRDFDSEILFADTAYGQGELMITPIQQAVMYSVFQNDGRMVYPKLLNETAASKTKLAITRQTANVMKNSLEKVVSDPEGTAHLLYNPQHRLAAKTGTAELKARQGETGEENSFLLAMDTEDNSFLMISLVEHYKAGSSATQLNAPFIEDMYQYLQHR